MRMRGERLRQNDGGFGVRFEVSDIHSSSMFRLALGALFDFVYARRVTPHNYRAILSGYRVEPHRIAMRGSS